MDLLRHALLGLFTVVVLSLTSQSANAADDCIQSKDMDEIVAAFSQFKHLKGKEFCYDGTADSALLEAIMFMRNTQFETSMPASADDLFSGKFASSWWKYFIGRINKFSIQTNCPEGAAAYVMGLFGGKTMYVCPLMLSGTMTALDRASIYMHEARHIDGFPHMTCTHGPRKGINGACDQRIKDGGSYAVTVETYAQLGQYATDIHPALKAYAKASSVVYANEAFEEAVKIDKTLNFMLLTQDKQFHELNVQGGVKVTARGVISDLGRIVMRGLYYVIFPEDKTLPAKFVFTNNEGDLAQAPGKDAAEYNTLNPTDKATWVTIHYAGSWGVKSLVDRVQFVCDPASGSKKDIAFASGAKPVSFIYPNGYAREDLLAYLMMDNGQVMEVGCSSKTSPYMKATNISFDRPMKRVYKSGNTTLALGEDGKLYTVNGKVSTHVPTALDGQIYELLANTNFAFYN
ncbi:MAG: hypothetical protein IT287_09990 [Bdellovibrionaceae bacterium]|nr:hypothetical protein [Pseudobdellovibrionaceae bacterium]